RRLRPDQLQRRPGHDRPHHRSFRAAVRGPGTWWRTREEEDRARLGRDVPDRRPHVRRPARRRDCPHRGPDDLSCAHARTARRRVDALMRNVVSSVIAIVVLTAVFGFAYPLLMTGFGQAAFSSQSNGSLIKVDGKVVGSKLAAQEFSGPTYFHERPSATSP